jgi:DNA-binding protein
LSQAQQVEVLVGKKPIVNYMLAIIEAFNNNPSATVVLKARGRAVCKAVNAVSAVKNRYFSDIYVKSFSASYEDVKTEKGIARLPSVEIVIARGPGSQVQGSPTPQ